ncbi:MAG TPA: hypothetical protein VGN37_07970 [Actinocatenispora sp.]
MWFDDPAADGQCTLLLGVGDAYTERFIDVGRGLGTDAYRRPSSGATGIVTFDGFTVR